MGSMNLDVFAPRNAAIVIATVSALALIGAYLFEYGWGYQPCMMCLWQRPPYYIAIVTSVIALLLLWRASHLDLIILILLSIAGLALLVNAGIGIFHAGVEWKFWQGPDICGDLGVTARTAEELAEQMAHGPVIRCDEASWRFLGLSLAGYSTLISAGLATISAMSVFKTAAGNRS